MQYLQKKPVFGSKTQGSLKEYDTRIQVLFVIISVLFLVIVVRLFFLMVINGTFYQKLASGIQEIYSEQIPERGKVYVQDSRTGETLPLALNKDTYLMYADTRKIKTNEDADRVVLALAPFFGYDDARKQIVSSTLNKRTDPYEPIEKKLDQEKMEQIKALKLPGIAFVKIPTRFYPEGNLAASVIGFVSQNDEGRDIGKYGIEGFWQKELAGKDGELTGTRSARGGWIPFDTRLFRSSEAKNGDTLILTLDRTVQYYACERLRKGMVEYGATSASLVILDPQTGAVRAMCSLPDFDPNNYGSVESIEFYNNNTIFTPYEPGSIFKPITMAAAINDELINPKTYFYDTGDRSDLCKTPIRNAESKIYNDTDMTRILQDSINTGIIYIAEQLGTNRFREYIEKFGFGIKQGIELDTESAGNIQSLSLNKKNNKIDCYTATASFGQGLTVTPLQMVVSYAAIANKGMLMSPYIIDRIVSADGKVTKVQPKEIHRVLSERSASLVSGMLVNVVEKGHATQARSEEYYIAGKTGTAQIPGPGGYTDETIHSFVGFAPVENPKFVMIVKYEKPQRKYAESTAVPVFSDISKFLLQYYQVMPGRK